MSKKKRFISLILAFMLIFCSFSASMVTFAGEKSAEGNGIGGGSPSKLS